MIKDFPKAGDKLVVKKIFPEFFYPHFRDMVEDAKNNLIPGEIYTVKKCEVYSSWSAVWLEEIQPSKDRNDRFFNLTYFEA